MQTVPGSPGSVMTHKLGVFGVGSGEGLFAKSPSPENIPKKSLNWGRKKEPPGFLTEQKQRGITQCSA